MIQDRLTPEEEDKALSWIRDRFGLPDDFFDGYVLTKPNVKTLSITNADIQPVAEPVPSSVGIPFLRVNMVVPKPTTGGAMWFGPSATRNVVRLSTQRLDAYLQRQDLVMTPEEMENCTVGSCLVASGQFTVSVGYLKDGILRNTHPKAWSIPEGVSAFEE